MWHASVSEHGRPMWLANPRRLESVARSILSGVGDAALGEWVEVGELAVHLRRRVSASEAADVGPVIDMRGTPGAKGRLFRAEQWLPARLVDAARLEMLTRLEVML